MTMLHQHPITTASQRLATTRQHHAKRQERCDVCQIDYKEHPCQYGITDCEAKRIGREYQAWKREQKKQLSLV